MKLIVGTPRVALLTCGYLNEKRNGKRKQQVPRMPEAHLLSQAGFVGTFNGVLGIREVLTGPRKAPLPPTDYLALPAGDLFCVA